MDHNYMENDERRRRPMNGYYYCMVHVIRPGDTLYRLSRQYGVKVSALMMANPFVDVYNLRIGDAICVPQLRGSQMPRPEMPMPRTEMQEQDLDVKENNGINYQESDDNL